MRLTLLLLLGCPGKKDSGGDDTGTTPLSGCDAVGFETTPQDWALPAAVGVGWRSVVPFPETAGEAYRLCDSGEEGILRYFVDDFTGDSRPDFVITRDECGDSAVGTDHWLVYAGGGGAFAETAMEWKLPSVEGETWGGGAPFETTSGQNVRECGGEESSPFHFGTSDMNADGIPDLIVTYDMCDGATIGDTRWDLYAGGATGFASTPEAWSLPAFENDTSAGWTWNTTVPLGLQSSGGGYRNCDGIPDLYLFYTTMELTGDGHPDLIITRDDCGSEDLSNTHWDVYPGSPTGFAATPVTWNLPEFEGTNWGNIVPFLTLTGPSSRECGGDYASLAYTVSDLDGDDVADFVAHYDECTGADAWMTHWDVYRGSPESGFAATATNWALPAVTGDDWKRDVPFAEMADRSERTCSGTTEQVMRFEVVSMTGEGPLDLVVTLDTCGDGTVGTANWNVYKGGASGFASTPTAWTLPEMVGSLWSKEAPFPESADDSTRTCAGVADMELAFTGMDLTGEGNMDLIVTYDACQTPSPGTTAWEVYPAACP